MKKYDGMDMFIMFLLSLGLGIIFCVICDVHFSKITKSYDVGYKQGQIDYFNNVVKYKLVKQNNSEMVWEEIKK